MHVWQIVEHHQRMGGRALLDAPGIPRRSTLLECTATRMITIINMQYCVSEKENVERSLLG